MQHPFMYYMHLVQSNSIALADSMDSPSENKRKKTLQSCDSQECEENLANEQDNCNLKTGELLNVNNNTNNDRTSDRGGDTLSPMATDAPTNETGHVHIADFSGDVSNACLSSAANKSNCRLSDANNSNDYASDVPNSHPNSDEDKEQQPLKVTRQPQVAVVTSTVTTATTTTCTASNSPPVNANNNANNNAGSSSGKSPAAMKPPAIAARQPSLASQPLNFDTVNSVNTLLWGKNSSEAVFSQWFQGWAVYVVYGVYSLM